MMTSKGLRVQTPFPWFVLSFDVVAVDEVVEAVDAVVAFVVVDEVVEAVDIVVAEEVVVRLLTDV